MARDDDYSPFARDDEDRRAGRSFDQFTNRDERDRARRRAQCQQQERPPRAPPRYKFPAQ